MSGRRARRRASVALGVVGLALLAVTPLVQRVGAQAVQFDGFTVLTSSDGIAGTFGDPAGAPYPVAAGQMPHTEASLTTGPTGYALASVAWPGPLVANAGDLAVLLGAPHEAGDANYGGRAEARSPGGESDAELGPNMRAHAQDNVAEATATVEDFASVPGSLSAGSSTTHVRNVLEAERVVGVAESSTTDIVFAEGLVTIDSVETLAHAVSDGLQADADGSTVVNGLEVNGNPATVDEEGVRFSDPAVQPVQENVLTNAGIEMFVTKPRSTNEGDAASYRSGSLVIVWTLGDSGYVVVYSIGGSEADARATRGSPFTPPTSPGIVASPSSSPPPDTSPTLGTEPVPTSTPPTAAPTTELAAAPISFTRELGIVPYVIGALFTAAAAWGLWRFREGVIERPAALACPNDRR